MASRLWWLGGGGGAVGAHWNRKRQNLEEFDPIDLNPWPEYSISFPCLAIATVKPFRLQPPKNTFPLPHNSWVRSCSAPLGAPVN